MEDQSQEGTVVVKSKFLDIVMSHIKTQGLPILLLAFAVWHFQGENKELQSQIKKCYEANNERMIEVITNNTRALDRIILQEQWQNHYNRQ